MVNNDLSEKRTIPPKVIFVEKKMQMYIQRIAIENGLAVDDLPTEYLDVPVRKLFIFFYQRSKSYSHPYKKSGEWTDMAINGYLP